MSKFVMLFGAFAIIPVVLFGNLFYEMHYKVDVVDTVQSADEVYEVNLLKVGEAQFPFGSASGQLVLTQGDMVISKADIEIAADGGSINKRSWSVAWYNDYVEIILSGSEQYDEQVALYYDGKVERRRLTTRWGKEMDDIDAAEDVAEAEDDLEHNLFPDEQLIYDGYEAIYKLFSNGLTDNPEVYYGARTLSSRCILSEDENTIEYLIYNGRSENEKCGLYVHYQSRKHTDGTWSDANETMVDIYAYVYESGDVVSSGKTHWGDMGSDAYREVTGEK